MPLHRGKRVVVRPCSSPWMASTHPEARSSIRPTYLAYICTTTTPCPNPSHSEGLLPNPSVGDVREVKRRRRRQVRSLEGAVTAKSEPSVRREPDLTVVVHLYFLFPELVPPPRIFTSCIYRDRVLSLLWRLAVETWSQSILVRSLALCVVVDPIRATPSRVSPSPESQPSS